jgi:hypothetical protein
MRIQLAAGRPGQRHRLTVHSGLPMLAVPPYGPSVNASVDLFMNAPETMTAVRPARADDDAELVAWHAATFPTIICGPGHIAQAAQRTGERRPVCALRSIHAPARGPRLRLMTPLG